MVRVLMVAPQMDCPADQAQFVDVLESLSVSNRVRVCLSANHSILQRQCKRLGIDCLVIPSRGAWDISANWRMHHLFSGGTADTIHLWDGVAQLGYVILARMSGRSVVVHQNRLRDPYSFGCGMADILLQNCEIDGISDRSVSLVGSRPSVSLRGHWHERFGIPMDAHVSGVASRLEYGAGLKDAIWATDLLKNVRDDAHLVISGSGPLEWRLRRFVRQCCVGDRVHFVDSLVPDEFVDSLDCLWLPTHHRQSLRLAHRAISRGIPVVATNLNKHQELFQHDVTGLIYPVGARRALAGQTYRLMKSPQLAKMLGANARKKNASDHVQSPDVSIHDDESRPAQVA